MDKKKYIGLFLEFLRYAVVGGLAFLADWGSLALFREFVFNSGSELELFFCTAIGFVVGLVVNYILSLVFVFREKSDKGKSVKAFLIFAVVGIIGLGLTELGMYFGVYVLDIHYMITKIVVAGLVLIWNYLGRKLLIFR